MADINPEESERDRSKAAGEGAVGKIVLIGLAVVVALFIVLAVIGRVIGFF